MEGKYLYQSKASIIIQITYTIIYAMPDTQHYCVI